MQKHLFFVFLLSGSSLFATSVITQNYIPPSNNSISPWFTGSLLAPGVETNEFGHLSFEPLSYFTTYTGFYDSHWKSHTIPNFYSFLFAIYTCVGISSFSDFACFPEIFYQFTEDQSSCQIGDLPFSIRFQLFKTNTHTWIPDIRLSLGATVPIGKYDHLSPLKLETDGVGYGSWFPRATLSMGKIFPISSQHVFYPSLSVSYIIPNNVPVKHLSIYGGGEKTKGTVSPGNSVWCDFSMQYNFTQKWAFACDIVYNQINKTTFSGHSPFFKVGFPSSKQISFAPALEYNWNVNMGLIGGVWFSAAGKNSNRFISAQLAFNLYI